ncbi:hypothetical protein BK126_15795 [Paenibacillus sp. FSL H7-0326]|uniref:hypothetical protein n=1 Tax=Paenibacillus sp. FSL H7-0326 TaxID=1921144 RepID=UPI00096C55AB|nr:hypothetical protein [Paenibacillus sp. FSL H7-0326]OMC69218.1 hypothetical protein BK126_15795 [Paenibacillus sp. FSL H7-0326]
MSRKNIALTIYILTIVYSLFRFIFSKGPLSNIEFILVVLITCSSVLYYFILEFHEHRNEEKISKFEMGIFLFMFSILLSFKVRDLLDELNPARFDGSVLPIDRAAVQLNVYFILLFLMILLRSIVGIWFINKLKKSKILDQ